jgi:hypothetical protein
MIHDKVGKNQVDLAQLGFQTFETACSHPYIYVLYTAICLPFFFLSVGYDALVSTPGLPEIHTGANRQTAMVIFF